MLTKHLHTQCAAQLTTKTRIPCISKTHREKLSFNRTLHYKKSDKECTATINANLFVPVKYSEYKNAQ